MRLTVSLVDGSSYASASPSLPLLYRVVFDEPTSISGPVRVTACVVENQQNSDVCAGYARTILSRPGAESFIDAGTELVLAVDALECEDGPSGLVPGEYEISAKVSVQVVRADGSLQHHELRASRQLVLS